MDSFVLDSIMLLAMSPLLLILIVISVGLLQIILGVLKGLLEECIKCLFRF